MALTRRDYLVSLKIFCVSHAILAMSYPGLIFPRLNDSLTTAFVYGNVFTVKIPEHGANVDVNLISKDIATLSGHSKNFNVSLLHCEYEGNRVV